MAQKRSGMEVKLQGLTKIFVDKQKRETTAVDKLTITVGDGKLIGLLGPSGCGKSTTLYMIAGLHEPSGGKIIFGDEDVTPLSADKRGIGLVFQNYALYPHLTIRENIMFPLQNMHVPANEIDDMVEEVARLVGIANLLERKPSQLSGGQQQRVAIARALVKKPKVLLLDEPLSNLDARLRLQMREEIKRIQKETGITAVFVTHDQEEAMSICDEIVLMEAGVEQQRGVPQQIYDNPANLFVAKFLGTPPINLFKAHIKKDRVFVGDEDILSAKGAKAVVKSWAELKQNHPVVERDNSDVTLHIAGCGQLKAEIEPLLAEFSKIAGGFLYDFTLNGATEGFTLVQGNRRKAPKKTKDLAVAKLNQKIEYKKYQIEYYQAKIARTEAQVKEVKANKDFVDEVKITKLEQKTVKLDLAVQAAKAKIEQLQEQIKTIEADRSPYIDPRFHLGLVNRELNPNFERATKRFIRRFTAKAVVPVVAPNSPLSELSSATLKAIFQKKLTKWDKLIDTTLPENIDFMKKSIHTVLHHKRSGVRTLAFQKLDIIRLPKKIFGVTLPTLHETTVQNNEQLIKAISENPLAIGFIQYDLLKESGLKEIKVNGQMATDESVRTGSYFFASVSTILACQYPIVIPDKIAVAFLDFIKTKEGEAITAKHSKMYPDRNYLVGIRPEAYTVDSEKGCLTLNYQYFESIGRDLTLIAAHPQATNRTFRVILSDVNDSKKLKDGKVKMSLDYSKVFVFDEETGERII